MSHAEAPKEPEAKKTLALRLQRRVVESMPAWRDGASSVVQVDSGARARVSGSHAGLCQYASVCTHATYM